MKQRAILLDRDGTLVHARHYPVRPEDLVLYAGLSEPLAALQQLGFKLLVITNQSGIARGMFDEVALARMHASLVTRLKAEGVHIDGFYFCPHHPEGVVPELAISCDCRKPQPGMVLRAAAEHNLDLARSWFIGDILDDVEAGRRAGCRTILVDLGSEAPPTNALRTPNFVARDTLHALALVAAHEAGGPAVEAAYLPPSWRALEVAPR
jgi:D-glycero-D-manno-heptose 1,7-bisphosphate phosphatase